ncbi:MAG TPA: hypothetical protein VGQ91_08475 [Ideonella sp.]|jgi:hypothetical protein|nr:hypothetical protein [Ideonella sp.]
MSTEAYLHQPSGSIHFWVLIDDIYIGAMIRKETLHYRFQPQAVDDDPLATYHANAALIDAAVRRRVAIGAREPVMLRDPDVSATAQ